MQDRLPESFSLDPKHFDHVLTVVKIDGRLHWNVHAADSGYRQTVLLTQPSQREVSSAVHKLQEALAVLGHKLGSDQAAIDLGETAAQHLSLVMLRIIMPPHPCPKPSAPSSSKSIQEDVQMFPTICTATGQNTQLEEQISCIYSVCWDHLNSVFAHSM